MKCMKCGRRIGGSQIFCEDCLEDMEKYPVKQDTPIQLPTRPANTPKRAAIHKKVRKPEDRIRTMKKWILGLVIAVLVLAVSLGLTATALYKVATAPETTPSAGQNYNTDPSGSGS